jgi:hypothetical protein
MLSAKCKCCPWKAVARGQHLLGISVRVHETATGHEVKVKEA